MVIKGILITFVAPMSNHIANGGEKLLSNASSIKRRPDGRVYISGQMQRHALFSAIDRLNMDDENRGTTYVSNGDGITALVEKDIRADLGGFLHTQKDAYSGRRTAPLSATPAVALNESEVGRDLLLRLREDEQGKEQAIATREYSQEDLMLMNFFIDIGAVSVRKRFIYGNGQHLETQYHKFATEEERKRRVRLAIEATTSLTDYANQARNAVAAEPQKVLLVFDTKLSRKALRYFQASEKEQNSILKELDLRGAKYFLGDDTGENSNALSVAEAYQEALAFVQDNELFDPTNNANPITTDQFAQAEE